jgi:deoxyribonuclease V
MIIQYRHSFDVDYHRAVEIQEKLRGWVIRTGSVNPLRLVAGADVSYAKRAEMMYAAIVITEWASGDVIEEVTSVRKAAFPYIPGLLSFREMPVLLDAFEKLRHCPDVIICDGHGIAHPRRFGIASHVGVVLDVPTIGCAKACLVGKHDQPGAVRGSWAPLFLDRRRIGTVLRTRDNVKPVFVSIGHRIGLSQAVRIVLRTANRWRLPEPIRRAHILSNAARRAGTS